jgi:WD40 repeat protein
VAASGDGIAYVWKLSDGKLKYRLWHADAPWGAGFLGGGASIVTTAGGTISVWDAQTGKSLEPHAAYIKPMLKGIVFTENGLAFDVKRKVLVTTHIDDTARLWDLSPAAATVLDPKCPRGSALLRVSRDGSRIIVRCGESGVIQVWDAAKKSKVFEFAAPRRANSVQVDAGNGMLLSPDGKVMALTDAGPVTVWSVSDGRKLASLPSGSGVLSATFDEQGRKLAVGSTGEVRIWDLTGPQSEWAARAPLILSTPDTNVSAPNANVAAPGADITARRADVAAFAFSPTGDRLLTLSIDATPRIWETATGKLLLTLSDPDHATGDTPAFLLSCAFSPDGRFVATYATGVLEVWEAASGKRLFPVSTGPPLIVKLEFSADGRRVMSAPGEGYMLNVEVPSGREMRSPANNADKAGNADNASLGGFAYDREAEVVAVAETDLQGGKDASLRLRDGRTFRGIWGFKGFYDDPEFSANGQRLTAVASDGAVHTWTLPPRGAERVGMARRLVPRCLGTLQREEAGLDPVPPRWCITGPDHVAEKDPSRWQGKWPYNRKEWREWLIARDKGESPPWPNLDDLSFDPAAEAAGAPPPPK